MDAPKDRDSILARFKEGPALLERALDGLSDADLDFPPSQGGWTVRQIVHHLADGDDIWKICIKMALGNEKAEFTLEWYRTQTQEEWGERWAYQSRSLDASLTLLKASRDHVLQLLAHAPDGWDRSVEFRKADGEIERVPVGAVVEIQANHIEHHVDRILAIRNEKGNTN